MKINSRLLKISFSEKNIEANFVYISGMLISQKISKQNLS